MGDVPATVTAGERVEVEVTLDRHNRPPHNSMRVFAPKFSKPVMEGWCVLITTSGAAQPTAVQDQEHVRHGIHVPYPASLPLFLCICELFVHVRDLYYMCVICTRVYGV